MRRKLGVCGLCVGFALYSLSGSLFAVLDAVFKRDIAALQMCERMLIRKQRCSRIGCSDLYSGTPCTLLLQSPFCCVSEAFSSVRNSMPALQFHMLCCSSEENGNEIMTCIQLISEIPLGYYNRSFCDLRCVLNWWHMFWWGEFHLVLAHSFPLRVIDLQSPPFFLKTVG